MESDLPRKRSDARLCRTDDWTGAYRHMGTSTHDDDLDMVSDALRAIETKYGQRVQSEVVGAFRRREPSFGRRVAPTLHDGYPDFVAWLRRREKWDIGIIPLADTEFNRSKSNLKFLEYSALRPRYCMF